MRHPFVKWFVFCSLLLGLQGRLFAQDPCQVTAKLHSHGHCHSEHVEHGEHGECPPVAPDHDQQCPPDHHHHQGLCAHATPFTTDDTSAIRLGLPSYSRLGLRHDGENAPDGPVLEEDIPPII